MITEQDVLRFPYFFNHDAARLWFKREYGKFFVLAGVTYGPEKIYHYHYVQDKQPYLQWRESLMDREPIHDENYAHLYQSIDITESGKVKVYYQDHKKVYM